MGHAHAKHLIPLTPFNPHTSPNQELDMGSDIQGCSPIPKKLHASWPYHFQKVGGEGVEEPRSTSAEDSWVTQKLYSPSARYYKSNSSPNNWASVPGHALNWALSRISSPESHQQKCGDLPSSFGKEGKSEEVMWSPKVTQHETELWSESRFSKPVNQYSGSVLMKSFFPPSSEILHMGILLGNTPWVSFDFPSIQWPPSQNFKTLLSEKKVGILSPLPLTVVT